MINIKIKYKISINEVKIEIYTHFLENIYEISIIENSKYDYIINFYNNVKENEYEIDLVSLNELIEYIKDNLMIDYIKSIFMIDVNNISGLETYCDENYTKSFFNILLKDQELPKYLHDKYIHIYYANNFDLI